MRDLTIPEAIPLCAAWSDDGFGLWDFLLTRRNLKMDSSIMDVISRLDSAMDSDRKFLVLLIGSSADILEAIHTLQALRYAAIRSWSPLLPVPNSTKLMSILTRYRAI